jgi:hypothetical protein
MSCGSPGHRAVDFKSSGRFSVRAGSSIRALGLVWWALHAAGPSMSNEAARRIRARRLVRAYPGAPGISHHPGEPARPGSGWRPGYRVLFPSGPHETIREFPSSGEGPRPIATTTRARCLIRALGAYGLNDHPGSVHPGNNIASGHPGKQVVRASGKSGHDKTISIRQRNKTTIAANSESGKRSA